MFAPSVATWHPILTVARHLVSAGHRVRMLTGSRFAQAVSATGAEFVALPEEADFDDRDLDAAFPRASQSQRNRCPSV